MIDFEKCIGNCSVCDEICEDRGTVSLDLDNGETVECEILTIYEACGKNYIALLPINDEGDDDEEENEEVYLYRFINKNGHPIIENIESDEEYDIAADGFDEWQDTLEYYDLTSDEDDDAD